ncbi:MAG TPA: AmmeMemoRadiSam system protein B [bacterium]|nr:AmmeMemoRadiSam system protein B [bacterium]
MRFALAFTLIFATLLLMAETRAPARAGQWYQADPKALAAEVKGHFAAVPGDVASRSLSPFVIVSPHAGFAYSGRVAAHAYAGLTPRQFDTVIIIGTSHSFQNGVVALSPADYFETPLGAVPVDRDIVNRLSKADKRFVPSAEIHKPEHSIEAQLPFLQEKLQSFSIVPVLTATNDMALLDLFAKELVKGLDASKKKILIIVSTDLSHFHDYDTARKMDGETLNLMSTGKWDALRSKIFNGACEACGFFAFHIAARVLEHYGVTGGTLVKSENSGDIVQESRPGGVVGYGAIIFEKKKGGAAKEEPTGGATDAAERKYLLKLARTSIDHYLKYGEELKPDKPDAGILTADRAVFVTLKVRGELRGCIGQLEARGPLYKAVAEMANSAAFHDPRFSPVKKEEMKNIDIEISILTPPQKIDSYKKIVLKRDGVIVRSGGRGGVFLPQVATETGWDIDTFLGELCSQKAGLPENCYKDKSTELSVFQVELFSEK